MSPGRMGICPSDGLGSTSFVRRRRVLVLDVTQAAAEVSAWTAKPMT